MGNCCDLSSLDMGLYAKAQGAPYFDDGTREHENGFQ